jgi:hypothetical protein
VEGEVLHRGIASRPFQRRFELAEHVHVVAQNSPTVCCRLNSSGKFPRL